MNYKLKLTLAVLATVLVFVLITCGALIPHLLNKDKDPAETTTGEDMNMTTPEETTGADTTVADTTIPETTEPEPTEKIYFEQDGIKLWDDFTDNHSLITDSNGLAQNRIQILITNNSEYDVVLTPVDVIMNGNEFAGGDNFDDVIHAGQKVLITLTFDETINKVEFSFIISKLEADETLVDLFTTDTITIRVGE